MKPNFNLEHQFFYSIITDYYNNPNLHQIKKDNIYTYYCSQLLSQTFEKKFIVFKIKNKNNNSIKLKELPWETMQIRILSEVSPYDSLPKHNSSYLNRNIFKDIICEKVANSKNEFRLIKLNKLRLFVLEEENKIPDKSISLLSLMENYNIIINLE